MRNPASTSRSAPFGMPTLGGKQLWADVFLCAGYRIQRNVFTARHRLLGPRDTRFAGGTYDACYEAFQRLRERDDTVCPRSNHLVLLLHGMFRSKDSFGPLTSRLQAEGFEAHGVNYPSTRRSLEDHADQVEALLERCEGIDTVSFVTHSMGGIVARVLLARDAPWRRRIAVNRLLMIATPNRGAEMATHLHNLTPLRAFVGPAIGQLGPDEAPHIPLPTVPFGLVAGMRGDGRGYNPLLPGDDDMTVTVDSVMLDGAEDTLVLRAVHTFIMIHPDVVEATIRYLRTGRLQAPVAQAPTGALG